MHPNGTSQMQKNIKVRRCRISVLNVYVYINGYYCLPITTIIPINPIGFVIPAAPAPPAHSSAGRDDGVLTGEWPTHRMELPRLSIFHPPYGLALFNEFPPVVWTCLVKWISTLRMESGMLWYPNV